MPVRVDPTPNPNALKFTIGAPVGGPVTFVAGTDDPLGSALLALDGVTSVFLTGDFVTLSKTPEADWEAITPEAAAILQDHFGV